MATWYAQNGSQDINAAWSGHDTMWNSAANGSGNWLTWSYLTFLDVLCANGKSNIAIPNGLSFGVLRLSTAAEGAGIAGGSFVMSSGSAVISGSALAGGNHCIILSGTASLVITYGSELSVARGSSTGNYCGITIARGASLNITGNAIGGSGGSTRYGISIASGGMCTITGIGYGCATGGGSAGINNAAGGTLIVHGSGIGQGGDGIKNAGTLTQDTGTFNGSSIGTGYGLYNTSYSAVSVAGDIVPSSSAAGKQAIFNQVGCSLTITGNVFNNPKLSGVNGGFTYMPAAGKRIQFDNAGGAKKLAEILAAEKVLAGTVHGDVVGTLAGANLTQGLIA